MLTAEGFSPRSQHSPKTPDGFIIRRMADAREQGLRRHSTRNLAWFSLPGIHDYEEPIEIVGQISCKPIGVQDLMLEFIRYSALNLSVYK